MRMRLIYTGWFLLILTVSAPRVSAEVFHWQIDGEMREAIIYASVSEDSENGRPLVLAFHGYGDNMENFQHTNVHGAWRNAIVVYPQGLNRRGGLRGWQVEVGDGDRDLRFVDEILTYLRESYRVDENRIYATGFSNGGMFAYLLWAERPDVFAAYAPVGARLRPSVKPNRPRPIFHVAGERDQVVRFADQKTAIEVAVQVNGVGASKEGCGLGCAVYGSKSDAPVMTWIHSGAHVYPRGTSERIVSFFRDHSRTP